MQGSTSKETHFQYVNNLSMFVAGRRLWSVCAPHNLNRREGTTIDAMRGCGTRARFAFLMFELNFSP